MATITYSSESTTLVLNGFLFNALAVGDAIEVAPVNEATSHVDSIDGVSITKRADADVHNLTVRVQKFSEDDIFLNTALRGTDPVTFAGSLKQGFTKDGTAGVDTWTLEGGSVTAQPTSVINNQDGNAVHEYVLRFRFANRAI